MLVKKTIADEVDEVKGLIACECLDIHCSRVDTPNKHGCDGSSISVLCRSVKGSPVAPQG